MKRYIQTLILLLLTSLVSPLYAAAETYTLDPNHTYLLFHIKHFGFSTQAGKWYATGSLTLDKEKPKNSKVEATVQVADIITGLPELDKHLKGKQFFDVEQYPTATFVSDSVKMVGKDSAKVHGMLTLHGVTKPVTLDVKLNQMGNNPITDKKTAGFAATTMIKRSDFGMSTLLPNLGDDIKLEIQAEAFIPK